MIKGAQYTCMYYIAIYLFFVNWFLNICQDLKKKQIGTSSGADAVTVVYNIHDFVLIKLPDFGRMQFLKSNLFVGQEIISAISTMHSRIYGT